MSRKENHLYYGWVILASCILMQAIPYCIGINLQPQFQNYVMKGEGFSLTQFSLLFTIATIVAAVASPFIGKLLSNAKHRFKLYYTIGAILVGTGFLSFSFAKGIWSYYLIASIVQLGIATISAIGMPVLINSWFHEKKGFALGLAYAGGGMGNIFLQKITANLLASKGYRYSYFIYGILALLVALPLALLFIRLPKSQDEISLEPKSKKNRNKRTEDRTWGYALKDLTKQVSFWLFNLGFVLVGLYVSAMAVQYISYYHSLNLGPSFVGTAGSILALFSILGNLLGGVFFDKLGIKFSLALSGILSIICGLSLIFLPTTAILGYVFVVAYGISVFSYVMGPSYLTGTLFGNKEYGTILGVVQIFFSIGFAAGSSLFGVIVDLFEGSYLPGWISATIFGALGYLTLLISSIQLKRKKESLF